MGLELGDRAEVERRARELHAPGGAALRNRLQQIDRQLPILARPMAFAALQDFRREQFVEAEELELDGIAPGGGGGIDEGEALTVGRG